MMYDIAIIGAGVVGSAIARELSRYAWKTVVLEKRLEVSEGTTKANSAIIHGGYDAIPGTLKAKLNVLGSAMVKDLAKELDFPFQAIGSLVIAFNQEEEKILDKLYARGLENGVDGLSIISHDEILALEPNVSDEATKALLCTGAGIVCPFNMTYALIENAMANGVTLLRDHEVKDLKRVEEGYTITTNQEELTARLVINAAGIETERIAAMLGETDYEIKPRRGEYRLLDRSEGDMVGHVIFQTPTELGKGVLVTPTVWGNLMIGPDSIEVGEDMPSTTKAGLARIDAQAIKSVPRLNFSKTIRVFSGLRATPDTGDFMIYASKKNPGFIHAAGIESPGLASSPAIAKMVLSLVLETGMLPVDKKYQVIEKRVGIKAFSKMDRAEREEMVKTNPRYGNIVCRCETVSEAEIIQAIRRPAGAVTTDGVKRRVRPGMGRCQGAFCGPKVISILAKELNIPEEEVLKDSKGSQIIVGKTKASYEKHSK